MKQWFWMALIVGLIPGLLVLIGGLHVSSGVASRSLSQEAQAMIDQADYVITHYYVGHGRFKIEIYATWWKVALLTCGVVAYLIGVLVMLRRPTP